MVLPPIAGWFISWENPRIKWMMTGGNYPHFRNPPLDAEKLRKPHCFGSSLGGHIGRQRGSCFLGTRQDGPREWRCFDTSKYSSYSKMVDLTKNWGYNPPKMDHLANKSDIGPPVGLKRNCIGNHSNACEGPGDFPFDTHRHDRVTQKLWTLDSYQKKWLSHSSKVIPYIHVGFFKMGYRWPKTRGTPPRHGHSMPIE